MTDDRHPYSRPELYDLEYTDYAEDLDHYLAIARGRRTVLELGCGTGRLTIPLAKTGAYVHGVDLSAPMLDHLARKLRSESDAVRLRIRTEVGDFRTFDAPARYPLVLLPFNAIHHCTSADEVLTTLTRARQALAPGGLFAMDAYLPDPTLYARHPEGRYEERTFTDPRTGETLVSWEEGWWDDEHRIHNVVYVYVKQASGAEERVHLQLHMRDLDELEDLIDAAGLEVISAASDFRGSPLRSSSLKWVGLLRGR